MEDLLALLTHMVTMRKMIHGEQSPVRQIVHRSVIPRDINLLVTPTFREISTMLLARLNVGNPFENKKELVLAATFIRFILLRILGLLSSPNFVLLLKRRLLHIQIIMKKPCLWWNNCVSPQEMKHARLWSSSTITRDRLEVQ